MQLFTTRAALAAALLGALALGACGDKSAQSGDGAVSAGSVGTAGNTATGQVVPTGANDSALNAPTETATAPAAGAPAAPAAPAEGAAPASK